MAIVRVALPVAVDRLFDYWLPDGLDVRRGSVLRARLGGRRVLGVAVELAPDSEIAPEQLAPIDEVASELPPLPDDLCTLARFISTYYQQPVGQCFAQMLPPIIKRRQIAVAPAGQVSAAAAGGPSLNADQRAALAGALSESSRFAPSLLQGVTGSGKTEVYFAAAARIIAAGRQALLLVP